MSPTPIFIICLALISGCTLALPELSPGRFVFGVRVGEPFRRSEPGRRALRIYYTHDITGILITIGIAAALGVGRIGTWYLAGVLPEVFAAIGYMRARRHVLPFAAAPDLPAVREAVLNSEEDDLPRRTWLALPPFLLPIAGALWTWSQWDRIPARIAIHFGLHGRANGWTTRTPLHLYGFFIFTGGLLVLLFAMAVLVYHGSRRSPARRTMLGMGISILYLMSVIFTGTGVWVVHHFRLTYLMAILPPYIIGFLYWNKRISDTATPSDNTPDEYWSLGDVYRNPNDPALFVPKRMGQGYTINFGNPQAKLVATLFFTGLFLLLAFLFWMQQ